MFPPEKPTRAHTCRKTRPQTEIRGVAALDPMLRCVLTVARLQFQSFATPELESWTQALPHAERLYGRDAAPGLVCGVLRAVQEMRLARQSVFAFSNPGCQRCAARLTGHERLLLNTLREMMAGRPQHADAHAMMLCEGNDTGAFLAEIAALSQVLSGLARPVEPRP